MVFFNDNSYGRFGTGRLETGASPFLDGCCVCRDFICCRLADNCLIFASSCRLFLPRLARSLFLSHRLSSSLAKQLSLLESPSSPFASTLIPFAICLIDVDGRPALLSDFALFPVGFPRQCWCVSLWAQREIPLLDGPWYLVSQALRDW